ncbi:MAG TPA: hypothetical protein VGG50_25150 [Streptosporangiaceae bacterium]
MDARNPALPHHQAGHDGRTNDPHTVQRCGPGPDQALDQRAGQGDVGQSRGGRAQQITVEVPAEVALGATSHRAAGDHLSHKSGEELVEGVRPARQQRVRLPALRSATTDVRLVRKDVPVEHRDQRENPAQRAGGQQAGDAGANHYGMPAAGNRRAP